MPTTRLAAVDFGQGVSAAWQAVATFVPKLVAFLVILLIGWLVAKILARVVTTVLGKVGLDRVVERGGLKTMLDRGNTTASQVIGRIIYYGILLVTLQVGFNAFGPNPISTLLTELISWLPRAIVAIVIVIIVGAVARIVKNLVDGALGGLSYGRVLGTIASVFIWGLGVIAALNQMEIATTVTTPVLIAVLAAVAGTIVVGVGGGLIRPMQQRWENWLGRAESEAPAAKAHAEAYQRGREDAARADAPVTQQPVTQQSATQQPAYPQGAHAAGGPQGAGYQQGMPPGTRSGMTPPGGPGPMPPPPQY